MLRTYSAMYEKVLEGKHMCIVPFSTTSRLIRELQLRRKPERDLPNSTRIWTFVTAKLLLLFWDIHIKLAGLVVGIRSVVSQEDGELSCLVQDCRGGRSVRVET